MRLQRFFASAALAAGITIAGSSALMAQDRDDMYRDRRDFREDYANVDRARGDMARDRARLNQDIRSGRGYAAADQARDMAGDRRRLNSRVRDLRHDRRDFDRDDRGY